MPQPTKPLGNLPVYITEQVHVMVNLGDNVKALKLTCPRADCKRVFILLDDPGQTATRACPYCFRTSKHV